MPLTAAQRDVTLPGPTADVQESPFLSSSPSVGIWRHPFGRLSRVAETASILTVSNLIFLATNVTKKLDHYSHTHTGPLPRNHPPHWSGDCSYHIQTESSASLSAPGLPSPHSAHRLLLFYSPVNHNHTGLPNTRCYHLPFFQHNLTSSNHFS